jgi:hypothetical protein
MKSTTRLALVCVLPLAAGCFDNRPILFGDDSGIGSPAGAAGATGLSGTGNTGGGGTTGGAGNAGGTIVPPGVHGCDVRPLFIGPNSTYKCSESAICHDASPSGQNTYSGAANFTLATADWQNHLVGVVPKGGGVPASICGGDPLFNNMPYIIKGDPDGDGLLMRKLVFAICSPGGSQMPFAQPPVSAADLACVRQWAIALAALP